MVQKREEKESHHSRHVSSKTSFGANQQQQQTSYLVQQHQATLGQSDLQADHGASIFGKQIERHQIDIYDGEDGREQLRNESRRKQIAASVEAIWAHYDTNENNVLERGEARKLAEEVLTAMAEQDFDEAVFDALFEKYDANGNGTIERDEMATCVAELAHVL